MIVKNKKNPTSGSSALVPEYSPSRHIDERKLKELEQSKKEHIKINREKKAKHKAKVLRNIIVGFILAITLIYRYCFIYNMEKNVMDVKKQISMVNAENESLKIGLLKYNNIELIEKTASEKSSMIPKSRTNVMYVNLNKDNFKEISKGQEKNKGNSFIEKIKKILF
ncbi:hypothetical protein RBU49_03650 [Clostridium sp. MB40-C1]|uniref:hypothetical protein n=1 Tax=Clostridium sp. MB40-C1 TaxID=3070996 RepID=UPI0027DFE7FF|nr:hypothetical protein [Clostridium sp. MB40-C1]WMJ81362.1 hypothetical protein RBU49_03650 [Clostridium sp. MB40-C1]